MNDTIVSSVTPIGRGGVAMIRLSGSESKKIVCEILKRKPKKIIPRKVYHNYIIFDGEEIDEILFYFFPAPNSYTGEDVVEITMHGNPHLVELVLTIIIKLGARISLPGEFTLRSLENKKMDLSRAEAVNDLINAGSVQSALMNYKNVKGFLSQYINDLREKLIDSAVLIETFIEFSEEQSLEEELNIEESLKNIKKSIETVIQNSLYNNVLENGIKLVIAGKVNVGKSSLFNHMIMRKRAIVSPQSGTTRDYIEDKIYVDNSPVFIYDVAGINSNSSCDIEMQGINRSKEIINDSQGVVLLFDVSRKPADCDYEIEKLTKDKKRLILLNKSDLKINYLSDYQSFCGVDKNSMVSVKNGDNLEQLNDFIKDIIKEFEPKRDYPVVNERQSLIFKSALSQIENIISMFESNNNIELIAGKLKELIESLEDICGEIVQEDVIKRIFSEFCVGK